MSHSPALGMSRSISRSAYLSSLPLWRRWLSILNWRPVVDLEIRAIEREKQIRQLESEIARLDELNAKLDALLCSSDTSSNPPPSTPGASPT